jgi:hypothetical protein
MIPHSFSFVNANGGSALFSQPLTVIIRHATFFCVLLLFVVCNTQRASAGLAYPGVSIGEAYGIRADIHTPSSANVLNLVENENSGQSSWVSTPGNRIIQTGWRYYFGFSNPKIYYELCPGPPPNNCVTNYNVGDQPWMTKVKYKVERKVGTLNTWCVYVSGLEMSCMSGTPVEATRVYAKVEIHYSARNNVATFFEQIEYRTDNPNIWWRINDPNGQGIGYAIEPRVFPYDISIINNTINNVAVTNMSVYRHTSTDLYEPIVFK